MILMILGHLVKWHVVWEHKFFAKLSTYLECSVLFINAWNYFIYYGFEPNHLYSHHFWVGTSHRLKYDMDIVLVAKKLS